MDIHNLLDIIKTSGYDTPVMFTDTSPSSAGTLSSLAQGQTGFVRFIELRSVVHRKIFWVYFPETGPKITNKCPEHFLTVADLNYKTVRQREYLSRIPKSGLVCTSKSNVTFMDLAGQFTCWDIDKGDDLLPKEYVDPELAELEKKFEDELSPGAADGPKKVVSPADDDIEIGDYPIENIYPVFDWQTFNAGSGGSGGSGGTFEKNVTDAYNLIYGAEETIAEHQVDEIIDLFRRQEKIVREELHKIQKVAYNIRCDITKLGNNLERARRLQEHSKNDRDTVRFKIDRLVSETIERLDLENVKLADQRARANALVQKYREYIEKF